MARAVLDHHPQCRGVGQGRFVDPAGAQGVVHVGDGHDAGGQRDGLAGQAVGIAPAVAALVVMARDVDGHLQETRAKPCRSATFCSVSDPMVVCVCMRTNSSGRQLAGLEQDVVGQPDLADVVQRGAALQHLDEIRVDLAGEDRRLGGLLARQRQ